MCTMRRSRHGSRRLLTVPVRRKAQVCAGVSAGKYDSDMSNACDSGRMPCELVDYQNGKAEQKGDSIDKGGLRRLFEGIM